MTDLSPERGARKGFLDRTERLLGSSTFSTVCFAFAISVSDIGPLVAVPLLIVFVNYSTKIEQIHHLLKSGGSNG